MSKTEIDKILDRALSGWPIKGEEAQKLLHAKGDDLEELFSVAREMAYEKNDNSIIFYQEAFPPISLTGLLCSLNCKHCNKYYLRHMIPAETPEKLFSVCKALYGKGVPGVLLSGGSRKNGTVPLHEFADAIAKIKKETNLLLIAHTGLVNYEIAKILKESGLDGVLIDVVGSQETTKKVFGIKIDSDDYMKTFKALEKVDIPNISPHICVGLHFGKLKGEAKALELVSKTKISTVVIVVLIPTEGTAMANVPPPSPKDVAKVVATANLMFPRVPVSLGCVRPGKTYRSKIDEMAIKAGVGKLAIPTKSSIKIATHMGLKTRFYDQVMCCCLNNF